MIYGRNVGLHPAVILLVLPAGAALAGAFGVFVAVPVTVFVASVTGSVIAALEPPAVEERARDVAPWLDRVSQWAWRLLIVLAVGIAAFFLVGQMPLVTVPILLAAILAATVAPVDAALRRRGWGRSRAAAVVTGGSYLAVLAIMVVAVAALGPTLANAIAGGAAGAETAADSTNGALGALGSLVSELGTNVLSFVSGILSAVAALALVFLLGGLLTFYLLRDGEGGWHRMAERFDVRRRHEIETTIREGGAVLGGYMGGTAVISLVGAASQAAIMIILGLPFVLPVAVLSFFACFIPYVGGFVSTGLAFLIAVAYGDATTVLIMGIYTIVFNIVQGNIVTPLVYRRAVHLHPAVILLAIPAGGALGGIAGMFLAVPVLAIVETARRPIMRVLDDLPEPEPQSASESMPEPAPEARPAAEAPAG
jgi:predicted PurR-regulated permease PerM